jgi:hypothetical protein
MTAYPGEHPEPPPNLDQRSPLIYELNVGATLFRLHDRHRHPIFFGKTGSNRFNSPDASFGVLYLGMDEHCAFIETFGSPTGIAAASGAMLEERHLAEITILQPLKLIDLSSSGGLARLGADARLLSGSHSIAQRWSAALRNHPVHPHGIIYPARHDPAKNACVIFDCSATVFRVVSRGSLMSIQNKGLLSAILNDYGFGLIL